VRTSRIRSCRQAGRGEKAVFLNRSLPVEEEPVSATTAWRGADMLRISIRPDADGPTLRTAARLHRTGRSCTELGGAGRGSRQFEFFRVTVRNSVSSKPPVPTASGPVYDPKPVAKLGLEHINGQLSTSSGNLKTEGQVNDSPKMFGALRST